MSAPEQVCATLRNHQLHNRTAGARLRDSIEHAKEKGRRMSPARSDNFSQTDETQRYQRWQTKDE